MFGFQTVVKANEIKDFEIEGISIGDSLLQFYNKSELLEFSSSFYPNSKKYKMMALTDERFEKYDFIQVEFLTDDLNYIIHSISGVLNIKIDLCLNKKEKIRKSIVNFLKDVEITDFKKNKHSNNYPNSYNYETSFLFKNKDKIRLYCMDWSDSSGFKDHLSLDLSTKEFRVWLNSNAYK
jgi:hypothetical protein